MADGLDDRVSNPGPAFADPTLEMRQWCLVQAFDREPEDLGKAIGLATTMMRLLEEGPPPLVRVSSAAPAAGGSPAEIIALSTGGEGWPLALAGSGGDIGPVEPPDQNEPGDRDPTATQAPLTDDGSAAANLSPAVAQVHTALLRHGEAGLPVTRKALADDLGKSPNAVGQYLCKLRDLGYARRDGNTTKTRWFPVRNADGSPFEPAAGESADSDPDPDPDPPANPPDRVKNTDNSHAHMMTGAGGKPGVRICLKCEKEFDSAGIKERICKKCKLRPDWRTGPNSDPQIVPS